MVVVFIVLIWWIINDFNEKCNIKSVLSPWFQIYWADSGELCCIATDESFFILKYSAENVAKAQETPEVMTEDGIEDAFDVRFKVTLVHLHCKCYMLGIQFLKGINSVVHINQGCKICKVSSRARHRESWLPVRLILPTWFNHLHVHM